MQQQPPLLLTSCPQQPSVPLSVLLQCPPAALTVFVGVFAAEGLSHCVPGAGAGESEGGAGDEEQPAAPEREEADGHGQTGECQHRPHQDNRWTTAVYKFLIL